MLVAKNIKHFYGSEEILKGINLEVNEGELLAITGESGSGKSTLLAILSTLLKPTSAEITFEDISYDKIENIDKFRSEKIGFIFQFHYLIDYLNVKENIELAASNKKNKERSSELLKMFNIENLASRYPSEISGGQRQRVAIVRALINSPKIIFADEPTGNLDSKNSKIVYELFRKLSTHGVTIVVATHDRSFLNYATREIVVDDGTIL